MRRNREAWIYDLESERKRRAKERFADLDVRIASVLILAILVGLLILQAWPLLASYWSKV